MAEKDLTSNEKDERLQSVKRRTVLTEFGSGVLKRVGAGAHVTVELENGFSTRLRKSQIFLPSGGTKIEDTRQIAQALGLRLAPNTVTEPAECWKPSSFMAKKLEKEKSRMQAKAKMLQKPEPLSLSLEVFTSNGYLGLDFLMDENPAAARVLQGYGFRVTQPYHYARVPSGKALHLQLQQWKNAGLTLSREAIKNGTRERLNAVRDLIKNKQMDDEDLVFQALVEHDFPNFYVQEPKPSNDATKLTIYPIIQGEDVYIALPDNQASSEVAIENSRTSIKWEASEPAMSYFGSMTMVKSVVAAIRKDGHTVTNYRTIRRRYTQYAEYQTR